LHSRYQPCSGWPAAIRACRPATSVPAGHGGWCSHIVSAPLYVELRILGRSRRCRWRLRLVRELHRELARRLHREQVTVCTGCRDANIPADGYWWFEPRVDRIFQIVDAAMLRPSPTSSPWMRSYRRAPATGRLRPDRATLGTPRRAGRDVLSKSRRVRGTERSQSPGESSLEIAGSGRAAR
jgi:hypothetical protein